MKGADVADAEVLDRLIDRIECDSRGPAPFAPGLLEAGEDLRLVFVFDHFEPDVIGVQMTHQHDIGADGLPAEGVDRMRVDGYLGSGAGRDEEEGLAEPP